MSEPRADPGLTASEKIRTFLSYSRKDRDAVECLAGILETRNDIFVARDTQGILPTEEWRKRLRELIGQADTIIFCLSPASVTSEVCTWEAETAKALQKRIIPIVIAPFQDPAPAALAELNYIFAAGANPATGRPASLEEGVSTLVEALHLDIGWIREHTRLGELSRRWQIHGAPPDQLLRGSDIAAAESWAARRPRLAPEPTELTLSYIQDSRKEASAQEVRARRRNRNIALASLVASVIMAALGWFFYGEWLTSERRQSLHLADLAEQETRRGDAITGQLLALEALPDITANSVTRRLRPYVPEAELQLNTSTFEAREIAVLALGDRLEKAAISPSGEVLRVQPVQVDELGRYRERAAYRVALNRDGTLKREPDAPSLKTTDVVYGDERMLVPVHIAEGTLTVAVADGQRTLKLAPRALALDVVEAIGNEQGTHLALRLSDQSVWVWNLFDGQTIGSLTNVSQRLVALGPRGEMLLTAEDKDFDEARREYAGVGTLWSVRSGKSLQLPGDYGYIGLARFSPSGTMVATATTGTAVCCEFQSDIRIWHTESGANFQTLKGHSRSITDLQFSPDGKLIASSSNDGSARLWDVKTGEETAPPITAERGAMELVRFSADQSTLLAGARMGTLWLHDPIGTRPSSSLRTAELLDANFMGDSHVVVTVSNDGTVRFWDGRLGIITERNYVHGRSDQRRVEGARVGAEVPEDHRALRIISTTQDKQRILKGATPGNWKAVFVDAIRSDAARWVTFETNRYPLLRSGNVRLDYNSYFLESGERLDVAVTRDRRHAVSFGPIAQSANGEPTTSPIIIWDVSLGREIAQPGTSSIEMTPVILDPTGKLALLPTEDPLRGQSLQDEDIARAIESMNTVRVVSLADGREVFRAQGALPMCQFTGDGQVLVTVAGGPEAANSKSEMKQTLTFLDANTGKALHSQVTTLSIDPASSEGPDRLVGYVGIAGPRHDIVVGYAGGRTEIWNLSSVPVIRQIGSDLPIVFTEMNRDGSMLVTQFADGGIIIWDTGSWKQIFTGIHTSVISSADFDADGKWLITTHADLAARIWSLSNGSLKAELPGHSADLVEARFLGPTEVETTTMETAYSPTTRLRWHVLSETTDLIAFTKARLPRCLTKAQRVHFRLSSEPSEWCLTMRKWPYQDTYDTPEGADPGRHFLQIWDAASRFLAAHD